MREHIEVVFPTVAEIKLQQQHAPTGRAMPVLETNCFSASEPEGQLPLSRQPFGLLFQALDDLKTHEAE